MTEREQLLQQQQLLLEGSNLMLGELAKPKPILSLSPPIISAGPVQFEGDVDFSKRSANATRARPGDQITSKLKLSMQGLHQHLADPPLPRGTTLGGLAQPLGHLRPVPNGLSIHYRLLRTLKP